MHLESYELIAADAINSFKFFSIGPKGKLTKLVQFQPTGIADLYNLAFGDKNFETNEIDDRIVSDNGDSEMVLSTVVGAIYIFTSQYPDARIYVQGSTSSRNRLYQMGVNKFYNSAIKDFDIVGNFGDDWEWYQRGRNYEAFIIIRKSS